MQPRAALLHERAVDHAHYQELPRFQGSWVHLSLPFDQLSHQSSITLQEGINDCALHQMQQPDVPIARFDGAVHRSGRLLDCQVPSTLAPTVLALPNEGCSRSALSIVARTNSRTSRLLMLRGASKVNSSLMIFIMDAS